ncbi:MAG: hypothetical protein RLN85_01050, partial [Pseudomonadales bacterium]
MNSIAERKTRLAASVIDNNMNLIFTSPLYRKLKSNNWAKTLLETAIPLGRLWPVELRMPVLWHCHTTLAGFPILTAKSSHQNPRDVGNFYVNVSGLPSLPDTIGLGFVCKQRFNIGSTQHEPSLPSLPTEISDRNSPKRAEKSPDGHTWL